MKHLIASDIHGSLPALEAILDYYEREGCEQLILLGDLLNYGPRNGIPEGINAPAIVERLNAHADHIIAVRGNCDSEVDQMLFHFDMMSTYAILVDAAANGSVRRYFLTHGHIYPTKQMPVGKYDAIFYGHTHLQGIEEATACTPDPSIGSGQAQSHTTILVNTGSPTFPKGGNPPTFVTLQDGIIRIHHLDGTVLKEVVLP